MLLFQSRARARPRTKPLPGNDARWRIAQSRFDAKNTLRYVKQTP